MTRQLQAIVQETMWSTRKAAGTCAYLGVDITDRYSKAPRPMDVCGIEISGGLLVPHFWTWSWGRSDSIDVSALLPEVAAAKVIMLDGPQALARIGGGIRCCERLLAAAGKTSDARPSLSRPYGGFIASSLDLFGALHAAGLRLDSTSSTRVYEAYPAAIWTRLARRLPNKRSRAGREARVAILKALGVALPEKALGHDELDACAAALLGAAADGRVPGIEVSAVGDAIFWDDAASCLREGQIMVPLVDAEIRSRLESVAPPWR